MRPRQEVTPLASPEPKIEFKYTPAYERTRRNYLFVCALLILFALAAPDKIKVPGFSDDAGLPAWIGYIALWFATLYFGHEYHAEHLVAVARNSEMLAGRSDEQAAAAILDRLHQFDLISPVNEFSNRLTRSIDSWEDTAQRISGEILSTRIVEEVRDQIMSLARARVGPPALEYGEVEQSVHARIRMIGESVSLVGEQLSAELASVKEEARNTLEVFNGYIQKMDTLRESLTQSSSHIYSSQVRSFDLNTKLGWGSFVVATLLTIARVVEHLFFTSTFHLT
ncbi:hypothetical protein J2W22_003012 [Sphingomonas kyeonggiensis]|uniref:hypothetical protein n=1 Tax=Sphingomonas kyeonggiensis TaxID=1268553 RepID=UPI002789831F|nr:hypothetical protein [Sphingomonas kyeonggiensis]MDQ0250948.1 hypothetical protein [Sphingomonas kyeonggiensis]